MSDSENRRHSHSRSTSRHSRYREENSSQHRSRSKSSSRRREKRTSQHRDKSHENYIISALDEFKSYLDKKLVNFERELAEESYDKTENALKKLKTENSNFKFAGNKIQFDFNEEILNQKSKIKRASKSNDKDKIFEICEVIQRNLIKEINVLS